MDCELSVMLLQQHYFSGFIFGLLSINTLLTIDILMPEVVVSAKISPINNVFIISPFFLLPVFTYTCHEFFLKSETRDLNFSKFCLAIKSTLATPFLEALDFLLSPTRMDAIQIYPRNFILTFISLFLCFWIPCFLYPVFVFFSQLTLVFRTVFFARFLLDWSLQHVPDQIVSILSKTVDTLAGYRISVLKNTFAQNIEVVI